MCAFYLVREASSNNAVFTSRLVRFPSVAGKVPSMQLLFKKILRAVAMLPRDAGMAPEEGS